MRTAGHGELSQKKAGKKPTMFTPDNDPVKGEWFWMDAGGFALYYSTKELGDVMPLICDLTYGESSRLRFSSPLSSSRPFPLSSSSSKASELTSHLPSLTKFATIRRRHPQIDALSSRNPRRSTSQDRTSKPTRHLRRHLVIPLRHHHRTLVPRLEEGKESEADAGKDGEVEALDSLLWISCPRRPLSSSLPTRRSSSSLLLS